MTSRPFFRRLCLFAAATLLSGGVSLLSSEAALADEPEVEISVSPAAASPGDTITVTEKLTNVHGFTILGAHARLLSNPGALTSYTTLEGCAGAVGACSTFTDGSDPVGYQAPVGSISGGGSATVVFTLKISPTATGGARVLQGTLFGSNYATFPIDGPTLTVITEADVSVRLTAMPRLGLLVPRIQFTVAISNHGPATVSSAQIRTALPPGLSATSSACTPGTGSVTCPFTGLAAGANASAQFNVPLSLLTIGVPYTFTATRTASAPGDPVAGNDSSSVRCTVVTPLLVSCA